jgi:rhamnosyltransferase
MKNEVRHLDALVESLKKQTIFAQTELIVLDSGSCDGSVELIEAHADKIYSIEPEEFQFGRSCNQVVSVCEGEFVLLLSAHVQLCDTDAIERAVEVMQDKHIAGVYFRQVAKGVSGKDFSSYERAFLKKRFPARSRLMCKSDFGSSLPVSNAGAVIRRSVWEQIPFPEIVASEDLLWARTVADAGFNFAYLADKEIVHNHNESPAKIYKRVRINKVAQSGERMMPVRGIIFFLAILLVLLVNERDSLGNSLRYATAHARAYF